VRSSVSKLAFRFSTSRNASTPPFEDNNPPSNLTSTRLPETGDKPGSGSVQNQPLKPPPLTRHE
jgi:hypothetical protein